MGFSGFNTSSLFLAGHKIDRIPEVPLVIDDNMQAIEKTKLAMGLLRKLKLAEEIQHVRYRTISVLLGV